MTSKQKKIKVIVLASLFIISFSLKDFIYTDHPEYPNWKSALMFPFIIWGIYEFFNLAIPAFLKWIKEDD